MADYDPLCQPVLTCTIRILHHLLKVSKSDLFCMQRNVLSIDFVKSGKAGNPQLGEEVKA